MSSSKRTYSRRTMTMAPEDPSPDRSKKRRKADDRNNAPPDRLSHSKSIPKSCVKKFTGPVSFATNEDGIGDADTIEKPASRSVLDRSPTNGRIPAPARGQSQLSLYGDAGTCGKSMDKNRKKQQSQKRDVDKCSRDPTLHGYKQAAIEGYQGVEPRQKRDLTDEIYPSVDGNRSSRSNNCPVESEPKPKRAMGELLHSQVTNYHSSNNPLYRHPHTSHNLEASYPSSSKTSKFFSRVIAGKNPSTPEPYIPRPYLASPVSVPAKNLFGKRIVANSNEADLWSINQSTSPLLCLPEEVRVKIYELILGKDQTICVEFHTWSRIDAAGNVQPTFWNTIKKNDCTKVVPSFRYRCTVFNSRINVFTTSGHTLQEVSQGFTLLSRVCRQLYQETAVLPYKLNRWAFYGNLTMCNFLVRERRITRAQREAITELVVSEHLPDKNILELLGGLRKVILGREWKTGDSSSGQFAKKAPDHEPAGVYRVVRDEQGVKLVPDSAYRLLK